MSFLDALKENLGAVSPDDAKKDNPKKDAPTTEDNPKATKDDAEPKTTDSADDSKQPDSEPAIKSDPEPQPDSEPDDDDDDDYSYDDGDDDDPEDDDLKAIRELASKADKDSAKVLAKIFADDSTSGEPKPQNKKEDRNSMQPLKFYEKIAEKIHDYDATGNMAPELRSWISGAIEDDKEISEDFVRKTLPRVLTKSPELAAEIHNIIKRVADNRPIPYKIFLINVRDTSDKKEYASPKEARESIKKEIELYGVNPEKVFKAIYRRVDADGNVGDIVPLSEVQDYVERFDGDKEALRQALRLPKKDDGKKPSNDQHYGHQKNPKNKKGKGGSATSTSNSDNSLAGADGSSKN